VIRVVFAGTPEFSVPCLHSLIENPGFELAGVISQPDRRAGRGMKRVASPVKQEALKCGLDVLAPGRLRDNEQALAWLKGKQADLLVVIAFGMLLPKSWLEAAGHGAINVHASLLPRWRGAAPIERAIMAGDSETGISIMRMDEGLDTGGVYAQFRVEIAPRTAAGELRDVLARQGAELLIQTVPRIVEQDLVCVPQDESRATYASKLQSVERNIDWSRSAEAIGRQLRAFSPTPGARSRLQGKWVKIIAGKPLDDSCKSRPGTLLINDKCLDVACGRGSVLRIEMLQVEGKRPLKADAFLQGLRNFTGMSFGI